MLCSLKRASILDIKVILVCVRRLTAYLSLPFPQSLGAALGKQLQEMTSEGAVFPLIHAYKHSSVTAAGNIMEFSQTGIWRFDDFPLENGKGIFK